MVGSGRGKKIGEFKERKWEWHGGSRTMEMKEGVILRSVENEIEVRFKPPALNSMVAPIGSKTVGIIIRIVQSWYQTAAKLWNDPWQFGKVCMISL